jgi:hypothetical protein
MLIKKHGLTGQYFVSGLNGKLRYYPRKIRWFDGYNV